MAFFGTGGTGADLSAPVEAPKYRPYERACGTEKPRYKIVAVVTALFGTLVLAVWTRLVFLRFGCRRVKRGLRREMRGGGGDGGAVRSRQVCRAHSHETVRSRAFFLLRLG